MKTFEYDCRSCRDRIVTQHYLDGADSGAWGHIEEGDPELMDDPNALGVCGPLKRVWSFGIAWPMAERGH